MSEFEELKELRTRVFDGINARHKQFNDELARIQKSMNETKDIRSLNQEKFDELDKQMGNKK